MPCSLISSSSPSFFLFRNTFTKYHFYDNKHYIKPKQNAFVIIYPFSKFLQLSNLSSQISFQSPFTFTITDFSSTLRSQSCCFTSKSTTLLLPEMKEPQQSNNKAKIEKLADKFKAIPAEERCNALDSLIKELGYGKNVDIINGLIMGLIMAEEMELALKVFAQMLKHGMLPDCWTYSILIRCYCKKNQPGEGKMILDCMLETGFRPNVVTLTILVNSLCSRGKIQRAFEVMEMMEEIGCNPNVHTYNCVLKGLCFVGRVEEAYTMLISMKREGDNEENPTITFPDIYSYTAVMDGLCKVGRSDEAMELLEAAIGMGLKPNVVTYNALFNGYCKEGKPRKGIGLLRKMKERGCDPDYITYSTLLHGLLKWDKFVAAFWVYREMVEVGFKVDQKMMNTLLMGLCKKSWEEKKLLKDVQEVIEKMKNWGYLIFPSAYYLVIQSFCIGKEVEMALITLNEMVEAGYFPRMVTINRLVTGLCEQGKMRRALSVLVLVCETRKIPSKIIFNILIDELNRKGNVLGACSIYGAALKLGVVPHRVPLGAQQEFTMHV